ncbi:hypothetical protein NQ315_008477 [Exocentrus adspersus]|uniref:Uncharacterized protein n=1 Tax=Exocentrus adspersus TaxID=1586481 RepID=A0AAV8W740_9CUCU|nr:hypothetical protein NQ315_008477 [Exocentrus adspersus]
MYYTNYKRENLVQTLKITVFSLTTILFSSQNKASVELIPLALQILQSADPHYPNDLESP